MTAVSWVDSKPVHFLRIGAAVCASSVDRRNGAQVETVPCPKVVRDYHVLMGWVDRHDQLRLQILDQAPQQV